MSEIVPPSKQALKDALFLSEEIIRNIEFSEIPLSNIALKTLRLARLLNDFQFAKIMEYETSGYRTSPEGVSNEVWDLAIIVGRNFKYKNKQTKKIRKKIYIESIGQLENQLEMSRIHLEAAKDPDISISSANPRQFVRGPLGNWRERHNIRQENQLKSERLESRRSMIYQYVLKIYNELKFSDISDDIFTKIRQKVDSKIGQILPESIKKFTAAYENLRSTNPEDWSNAVHSCRRILQDLADAIFPPRENLKKMINGKEMEIALGQSKYINRILTFIDENSDSERFSDLIGSNLKFIEDRLINVFKASQKGSHETITSREEANRYVVYTYLLIGDILSLIN